MNEESSYIEYNVEFRDTIRNTDPNKKNSNDNVDNKNLGIDICNNGNVVNEKGAKSNRQIPYSSQKSLSRRLTNELKLNKLSPISPMNENNPDNLKYCMTSKNSEAVIKKINFFNNNEYNSNNYNNDNTKDNYSPLHDNSINNSINKPDIHLSTINQLKYYR